MRAWLSSQDSASTGFVEGFSYERDVLGAVADLKGQLTTANRQTDRERLKRPFQRMEFALKYYYGQTNPEEAATITGILINSGFVHALLATTRMAIVDAWPQPLQRTLASFLHFSVRLLWLCHTGQGQKLDEEHKSVLLEGLHGLCGELAPPTLSFLKSASQGSLEVFLTLCLAREAALGIQDRSTWSGVAMHVVQKLLSPVGMLKLLRDLWRNAPEGWYPELIALEQQVGSLVRSAELSTEVAKVQERAMKHSGYKAFRYGLRTLVWLKLQRLASLDRTLQQQLRHGTSIQLGTVELDDGPKGCCDLRSELCGSRGSARARPRLTRGASTRSSFFGDSTRAARAASASLEGDGRKSFQVYDNPMSDA